MATTASTAMQKANIDSISPDIHGLIRKQTAHLEGVDVTRVQFGVGARWSHDLKDYAGTELCELPHVALVLSGRIHIVMADGTHEEFGRNDVMLLPPRPRRMDHRRRTMRLRRILQRKRSIHAIALEYQKSLIVR